MEEDNKRIELLRKVLVKKKKLERTEVAELLDYDLEDDKEAKVVDELLEFLKESNILEYVAFRCLSEKRVARAAEDPRISDGSSIAYLNFHKVLNTALPPVEPTPTTTDNGIMPMTDVLRDKLPPSAQVASDEAKKNQAKEEFYLNVTDVTSVFEDEFVLKAFLISRGEKHYLTEEAERTRLADVLAHQLAFRANGLYHKSISTENGATERAKKVAKMDELALNADGTACEDSRSSSFARGWNCNLGQHQVLACPQFIAHKSGGSIKRSDVVFCQVGVSNSNNDYKDTLDYPAVMEWKNSYLEGADREGATYALLIQQGIGRKRFLVFSVSPGRTEVFGLYWKAGETTARRVILAEYDSLTACLKEWLEAILYFVLQSASDSLTPTYPVFEAGAKDSKDLTQNVFKVTGTDNRSYVYKVYDYTNRQGIARSERRWLNWELVEKFYPDGHEKIADLPSFKIFRYPFQDEGAKFLQHVPPSIELFKALGEQLRELHSLGWIWGDARFGNMLFISDRAYPIDFDFARKVDDDHALYPNGYITDGLPRHPSAKAGHAMKQEHDVYSYWRCFQVLRGSGDDCPGSTMEDILPYVSMEGYVRLDPTKIPELTIKTEQGSPVR